MTEETSPREKATEPRTEARGRIFAAIAAELDSAYAKHGDLPWGRHEFYAILLEEVEETWDAIKGDEPLDRVAKEAIQSAAMCVRYLETGDRYQGSFAIEAEAAQGAAPLDDTECICASLAASDLRSLRWQREFGFDPLCPVDHDPRPEGAAPLDSERLVRAFYNTPRKPGMAETEAEHIGRAAVEYSRLSEEESR